MIPGIVAAGAASGGGGPTDPNFANVVLLLHMDGADASTTFTDNSSSTKTVTASGNAQIDTAQSKFGGASGLFDGTGDYLTVPNSADFDFGSGDWTIETWIRVASIGTAWSITSKRATTAAFGPFLIYVTTTGLIGLFVSVNGSSWGINNLTTSVGISASTWAHVAVTRSTNTYRIFVNGVERANTTLAGTLMTNSSSLSIAAQSADGGFPLNGHLDDFRITKGVARYTSGFTPPTAAFPNS